MSKKTHKKVSLKDKDVAERKAKNVKGGAYDAFLKFEAPKLSASKSFLKIV